jgi:hypothetical protein
MFVGVLCNEGTAPLLVQSGLVNTLFVLMGEKKEDDEFVLQISFAFNKFLMYDDTRMALLNYTQVRSRGGFEGLGLRMHSSGETAVALGSCSRGGF